MDIQKFQQKLTEVCELGEKNGKVLKPEQIKECFDITVFKIKRYFH